MSQPAVQPPQSTSVILLAAGHGNRMRPLTDSMPKPLLKVGKYALIEHHLYRLRDLGFKHVVINTAYLGSQIHQALGNGLRYGLEIEYSDESDTGALETAGGIKKSLDLLRSESFIAINADIFTDFDFTNLIHLETRGLGYLVLVENPDHNPNGDFNLDQHGNFNTTETQQAQRMTYSGIARYQKNLFRQLPEGKLALGPILKRLINQKELSAILHTGRWTDVGTPERLEKLNESL